MSKKDTCEIYCYDEEKVNRIQGELQKEDISSVVLLFKALADEIGQKLPIHFAKMKSYVYVILPISLGLLLQPLPIIYGLFINKGL
ncbi:hypothetical protein Gste01_01901 [Geobacillus stearothermophilus ATCC 7953]